MKKKKTAEPDKQIEADERNIVAVDEAYKEAGFEDRMYLFWEKYSTVIIALIAATFVGIILYFTMLFLAERREAAIQAEYAAAETTEQKETFARDHSGHRLAGAAALDIADLRYNEEDYEQAAEWYGLALESLDGHPLYGRAGLGKSVSYILLGRTEDAGRVLSDLADNEEVLLAVRMEAKYTLASLAFEAGDYDRVRSLAESIEGEDMMGIWSGRARRLVDDIP